MERTMQQGSAAPLSRPKDAGDNGPTKHLTREEHVFELDQLDLATKLYVGDRLDTEFSSWGTIHVYKSGRHIGRIVGLEAAHFPSDLDIDTWSCVVASVTTEGELHGPADKVRLIPFEVKDCGCVFNRGGWAVRRCDPHEREIDELLGDKRAYEGHGTPGWDDDPRHEQEQIHRAVSS